MFNSPNRACQFAAPGSQKRERKKGGESGIMFLFAIYHKRPIIPLVSSQNG